MGAVARRALAFGATILAALAIALLAGVDWEETARQLAAADPRFVALGLTAALASQLAWASVFAGLFRGVHRTAPANRVRLAYLGGTFVKQVLPYGHLGSPALLTYVLAEDMDLEYRPTFASVTAAELLVFLASLLTVGLGLGALVAALVPGPWPVRVAVAAGVVLLLSATASVAPMLIDERLAITRLLLVLAALGRWAFGRALPRVRRALAPETVRVEAEAFFDAFERATAHRPTLLGALAYALAGWLLFSLSLYAGFLAVGEGVPIALVLFLVPASGVVTFLPTPGGLGGTEVGLTAAVVVLSGTSAESAAAAVLIFRACTYWFVILVGAASALYLSVDVAAVTRYPTPQDARGNARQR